MLAALEGGMYEREGLEHSRKGKIWRSGFTHRVAFEEGSGPRVLLKSGPGNRGRSACGPTHVARLEFPRAETRPRGCSGLGEPRPALPSF